MVEEYYSQDAKTRFLIEMVSRINDRLRTDLDLDCEHRVGHMIMFLSESVLADQIVEITARRRMLGINFKKQRLLLEVYPFNPYFKTKIDIFEESILEIVREEAEKLADFDLSICRHF